MKRRAQQAEDSARVPRLANGAPDVRRLLTWARVQVYLDMGYTAAWKLRRADPRFPKAIRLPGVHPRWDLRDLDAFVERVKAERDESAA